MIFIHRDQEVELTRQGYICGFDGVRGISILLVFMTHLGFHRLLPPGDFFRGRLWALMSSEMGVNMFFGLSGFLITTLLLREQGRAGTIQLKKFYARRLLPLLAVYLVIVGILHLADWVTIWTPGLLVSFLYAYNFMITTHAFHDLDA